MPATDQEMSDSSEVEAALRSINRAWLEGRPRDMAPAIHPGIVFFFPGFAGRTIGRDAFLAGFVDFVEHARVESYDETNHQTDLIGNTAVLTYTFAMVYTRERRMFRCGGRDLWMFTRQEGKWVALWRTMLDVNEVPA